MRAEAPPWASLSPVTVVAIMPRAHRWTQLTTIIRRALGWPARRVMDRRIEWILSSFAYRQDRLEAGLWNVTDLLGEALLDRRLARLAPGGELALPMDTARFLDWAEGPNGPAARAGAWFNPPVAAHYRENAVGILLVNERIVEQPYVFAAVASLARPARILDVGGAESTVALSLASLGHQVDVVDPRGYSLAHPNLRRHAMRLDELPAELQFDAAIALSSIEHFGVGAYGQPARDDERLDRAALAEIRERLTAGGVLVLTVPCAAASTADDFQRVYSIEELRDMLAHWETLDLSVAWRLDGLTWTWGTPDDPKGDLGVALVTARKPAT
jgi:SAM-dependent methyltransferase